MKCEKCGYSDNGTGDWAHVCGPVKVKHYSNTNNPIDFPKNNGMNERIKELSKQALKESGQQFWWSEVVFEKFAELIVRECAEIALTEAQSNGNFDTFNKIVKHFGVKI